MDSDDVFGFLGKCLGAAIIFKGVDMAGDAIQRRRIQNKLQQAENERQADIEDLIKELREEIKRLRDEKDQLTH